MFLEFIQNWLKWRYVKQTAETHAYHRGEVPEIPEGYYAVVSVELKPLDELPQPLELEKELAVA